MNPDFPRAILHIDGDSFFASCEIARNPTLRGKPVVTGLERGIASSMNYVAKARGITRAMRLSEIRKICPDVVMVPSDYRIYAIYSRRMCTIVRRYSPRVEEYSIDECFADLTQAPAAKHMSYETIARNLKRELEVSLGLTFSFGLSVNKVLSKAGSKWQKPAGFTVIPKSDIETYTARIPIGNIWGIGYSTATALRAQGIVTALDLAKRDRTWVEDHFARPAVEIYEELRGNTIMAVIEGDTHKYSSIQKTGTFRPPSRDKQVVFSELSHHIENACNKLRENKLQAGRVRFFLKTQEFEYINAEIQLSRSVSTPHDILKAVANQFEKIFLPHLIYRATGVILSDIRPVDKGTNDLFGSDSIEPHKVVYETVDALSREFGRHTIFLGSSLRSLRSQKPDKKPFFQLPHLGEVT